MVWYIHQPSSVVGKHHSPCSMQLHYSLSPSVVQNLHCKSYAARLHSHNRAIKTHVRYQDDRQAAEAHVAVTAEETYKAAEANMPGAWGGRWERWGPPANNMGGIVKVDDPESGWQLLTSGRSVYVFKAVSADSLSVSVMEAADPTAISMTQAAAQLMTEAALGVGGVGGTAAPQAADSSNVMRTTNKFSKGDDFFRPFLPDHTQPGGDLGLRLWGADGLGFIMAPTSLPHTMMHTKPLAQTGAAAAAASRDKAEHPFIANLYIRHPSKEPGIGRRWGWNLQYSAAADSAAAELHQAGPLQNIHHTSLGVVELPESQAAETVLHPGDHTRPPTAPRQLPPSIAAFMAVDGHTLSGSAVQFSYDAGRLVRRDVEHCSWAAQLGPGPGPAGGVNEVWYSSGGYTRCPVSLQAELMAGRPVVLEAGAILYRDASLSSTVLGIVRWLLTYRAGDGQLDHVRMEVYNQGAK